jgi:hypothetical protein
MGGTVPRYAGEGPGPLDGGGAVLEPPDVDPELELGDVESEPLEDVLGEPAVSDDAVEEEESEPEDPLPDAVEESVVEVSMPSSAVTGSVDSVGAAPSAGSAVFA